VINEGAQVGELRKRLSRQALQDLGRKVFKVLSRDSRAELFVGD